MVQTLIVNSSENEASAQLHIQHDKLVNRPTSSVAHVTRANQKFCSLHDALTIGVSILMLWDGARFF